MPFKDGEQVGPYRVMEQLGRGGMATVFKAYHANLDRYVAIKVLHPAFMEDPNFEARFQREAKVVAKLEHPNIIPIYDFSEHDGRSYLVMKYVEGETLKARLNRNPLTPEEGLNVIEAVGEGLSYAHHQGILHRDVKPSNVMIGNDGRVYLTDFGLARIASAGESTLSSDMMIGTPQYISPEQAMGKRELDEGTDIYSFGVLIYELVVGKVPFISDTPFSIIHDHIYTPLPLPRAVNPKVPESIERVLLKALAKERPDRFESVTKLVTAFKEAAGEVGEADSWAEAIAAVAQSSLAPTEIVGTPAGIETPPVEEIVEPTEVKKKSKLRRWWWVPVILGICFCLFVLFSNRDQQGQINTSENEPPVVDVEPREEAPLVDQPIEDREAAVEEALRKVEENPEDPIAHLELALALLLVGNEQEAIAHYEMGAELAERSSEFYVMAGNLLGENGIWLFALQNYVAAYNVGLDQHDQGVLLRTSEAAYFAAEDPKAWEFFFQDMERENEIGGAARARFVSIHQSSEEGLVLIEEYLEKSPNNPMGLLVQAEILIQLDRIDEAQEILTTLIRKKQTPEWIKNQARELRESIN